MRYALIVVLLLAAQVCQAWEDADSVDFGPRLEDLHFAQEVLAPSRFKPAPPPPPPPVRYVKDMRVGDVRWVSPTAINVRGDGTCCIDGTFEMVSEYPIPPGELFPCGDSSVVMSAGMWVKVTRKEGGFAIDISADTTYVWTVPYGWTDISDYGGGCFTVIEIVDGKGK